MALQDFIVQMCQCSKNQAKRWLDARHVFVDGRRIWMTKHKLRSGQTVEVNMPPDAPIKSESVIPVLWQCDDFLVINKPAGLESNLSPNSVEVCLQKQLNSPRLCAVHRLDRDTTGCLIYASNSDVLERFIPLFKAHKIEKMYHALVMGKVAPNQGTISRPLDGKSALTHYRVIRQSADASLLHVRIETGRTHQIRRHFAAIKHPLIGDTAYFGNAPVPDIWRNAPRQMLHAAGLAFPHPESGERIRVSAPDPCDFTQWTGRLLH